MSHSSGIFILTDTNFQDFLQKNPLALVDFWAPWCAPCQRLLPILETLCTTLGDKIALGKFNIEEFQGVPAQHNIVSLPTLILFHEGQEKDRRMGFCDGKTLETWVNGHLTS